MLKTESTEQRLILSSSLNFNDGGTLSNISAPTLPMPTTSKVTVHHTSCQDGVVSCMTSCRYGYFLKASENGGCPRCHCLPRKDSKFDWYSVNILNHEFICIYIQVCLTYIWRHICLLFQPVYFLSPAEDRKLGSCNK